MRRSLFCFAILFSVMLLLLTAFDAAFGAPYGKLTLTEVTASRRRASVVTASSAVTAPPAVFAALDEPPATEETITVRLLLSETGEVRTLPLEEYIIGVVMAEMPVSFAADALRAQAVAARTHTLYQIKQGSRHTNADICSNPGCCQAWIDPAQTSDLWGEETAEKTLDTVRCAVSSTAGEVLLWQNEPICAAFHASSDGYTASSAEVWGGEIAYLCSVPSPEILAPKTLTFSPNRFAAMLSSVGCTVSGDPDTWLGKISRTESGRVATVTFCGKAISGAALRRLFSLSSTSFSISYFENTFTIQTSGSGHGVGMSQYGADAMARAGKDYREILAHYYPGTEISRNIRENSEGDF